MRAGTDNSTGMGRAIGVGMTRSLLAGLALMTVSGSALAYGPDCQATAEFHYEVACEDSWDDSIQDCGPVADAAYEDAIAACNAEPTAAEAHLDAGSCQWTSWVTYTPGGFVAVCGDENGRPLYEIHAWGEDEGPQERDYVVSQ
jgi:hypothetical protein